MSSQLTKSEHQNSVSRIKNLLQKPDVKSRFDEVLGNKSAAFMSSLVSACSMNQQLAKCEPMSVISSAAIAASMDLPINPSLGFAHIVPYGNTAQFQMGWKGFVQLAMRTGKYKTINAAKIYEGQIKEQNPFTGKMVFQEEKTSDKIIGYLLYFELINGFEKYHYMTKEDCEKHAKKYSASYKKGFGQWKDNFDAMALKTVVKLGLSKYGILSIDMEKAIEVDQSEVSDSGGINKYPDAVEAEIETGAPDQEAIPDEGPSNLKKAISSQGELPI